MINFMKISQGANVLPLLLALKRRPDVWKEDTYLRDYSQSPFGEMESVILRFPPRSVHESEEALKEHLAGFDEHENIDQEIYAKFPEARPLIFGLMSFCQGERLGRVMINKLAAGGSIFPHADTPSHAAYYSRFHIVLQSEPGVVFRCGDENVYMGVGEVWWFNNKLEHEVINNSATDRIHMIVDIRTSAT